MNGSPMPSLRRSRSVPPEAAESRRAFDNVLDTGSVDEIVRYMATEPNSTDLRAMTQREKDALTQRHTWVLVHYLRSGGINETAREPDPR
jgi:hypothetical protein